MFVSLSGDWWLGNLGFAVVIGAWYKALLRETDRTASQSQIKLIHASSRPCVQLHKTSSKKKLTIGRPLSHI